MSGVRLTFPETVFGRSDGEHAPLPAHCYGRVSNSRCSAQVFVRRNPLSSAQAICVAIDGGSSEKHGQDCDGNFRLCAAC